jgi:hypothetical protein
MESVSHMRLPVRLFVALLCCVDHARPLFACLLCFVLERGAGRERSLAISFARNFHLLQQELCGLL